MGAASVASVEEAVAGSNESGLRGLNVRARICLHCVIIYIMYGHLTRDVFCFHD